MSTRIYVELIQTSTNVNGFHARFRSKPPVVNCVFLAHLIQYQMCLCYRKLEISEADRERIRSLSHVSL